MAPAGNTVQADPAAARTPAACGGLRCELLRTLRDGFPLRSAPFDEIGRTLGASGAEVLRHVRHLHDEGAFARIGGVWGRSAGRTQWLCRAVGGSRPALPVPGALPLGFDRCDGSAWYAIAAVDDSAAAAVADRLEAELGAPLLRLPQIERLDADADADARPMHAIAPAERALAALVDAGLPLVSRPYTLWAQRLGLPPRALLETLRAWVASGVLSRFGSVGGARAALGRDRALLIADLPDELVAARGRRIAGLPGVLHVARRERAADWPYNLYVTVIGASDEAAVEVAERVAQRGDIAGHPHRLLTGRSAPA
jgi:siroheme decarboxylase